MPSGSVEHHDRMFVRCDRCGEAIKEMLHGFGRDIGQDKCEGVVGAGFHGRENIGEGEALVGEAWGTLAARPPDMADTAFLADPGLVLEEQPDALAGMCISNSLKRAPGSF